MLRLLVISDSHGKVNRVIEAIGKNKHRIDRVCFLGDGIDDIKFSCETYPDIEFDYVLGNNDYHVDGVDEKEILCSGKKILLTHGHLYEGILGVQKLVNRCKRDNIDAVFMGHTHRKREVYIEGILFLNPGSIGRPFDGEPSYSIVNIGDTMDNQVMYI